MNRYSFYKALIAFVGMIVLAGGSFAQVKHGGGDKHGGGGGRDNGGGHEWKQQQRGNEDRGDRGNRGNGNGNAWGRQRGGDDQRGRQQQWFEQRQQQQNQWNNARRQQQEQQQVWRQQQQYQQQITRQQQQYQQQAARQQQQYQQQAYRQQLENARRQYNFDDRGGRGRGKHNGWTDDGPRGNAYGLRSIWPGQFRGWRDPDNQERRAERNYRRTQTYYYSDPLTSYYPVYQQPNYRNGGYSYYNQPGYTRENVVRSIISSFFSPQPDYYGGNYYAPAYQSYSPVYYQPQYYRTGYGQPYYSQINYSSAYGSPYYYGQGYDPYGGSPLFGSQLYGGGGLKSSILNIGLSLLQGFLGQGYAQGLDQGQYVRSVYGTRYTNYSDYYDPYAVVEPAYYSPLVSSFADQRQLLEEGYRLGYQDAMRNRDPYGTSFGGGRTDLVSEFLANTLSSI